MLRNMSNKRINKIKKHKNKRYKMVIRINNQKNLKRIENNSHM